MMGTSTGPATVHDVAAKAEVSIATVSRVLAEKGNVRPETARRVRRAMAALGYEPNRAARTLRSRRTRNIAIVLPHFHNQFYFQLIEQAVLTAREAGFSVVIAGAEDVVAEANRLAVGKLVDGLVIVGASSTLQRQSPYENRSVPVVAFDRAPLHIQCPTFQVDNRGGVHAVVQHLADTGARRIAHIAGPASLEVAQIRVDAYRSSVSALGYDLDPQLMVRGNFSEASGATAMEQLLALDARPDAVFAANDLMAIGALGSIGERGLSVPRDIRIAGFDGITAAAYTVPQLTTYAQPVHKMALAAVNRVVAMIDDGLAYGEESDRTLFRGELVVRASTQLKGAV